MRLSDAIRLGAMLHPQGFGVDRTIRWDQERGPIVMTCAIGAAIEAMGENYHGRQNYLFTVNCPIYGCVSFLSLVDAIVHLNDHHRWTRETIADWVEVHEQPVRVDDTETGSVLAKIGK